MKQNIIKLICCFSSYVFSSWTDIQFKIVLFRYIELHWFLFKIIQTNCFKGKNNVIKRTYIDCMTQNQFFEVIKCLVYISKWCFWNYMHITWSLVNFLAKKKHTVNSKIMVCINHCKFVNSVLMKSMLSEIVLECNLYNERILQKT